MGPGSLVLSACSLPNERYLIEAISDSTINQDGTKPMHQVKYVSGQYQFAWQRRPKRKWNREAVISSRGIEI